MPEIAKKNFVAVLAPGFRAHGVLFSGMIAGGLLVSGCGSSAVKPTVAAPSGASATGSTTTSQTVSQPLTPPPQIQVFHPQAKTSNFSATKDLKAVAPSDSKSESTAESVASIASTGSTPAIASPVFAQQVTTIGDNFDAVFSPDGTKILFESRNRVSHKQAQAYELHLATMVEKRITFQDGDVSSANYYPDGHHLIYASTTDEIKEESIYVQNIFKTYLPDALPKNQKQASKADSKTDGALSALPSSDIYRESFDGREIERLTTSVGFDGEPSTDVSGKRILFTSERFGAPNLFIFNSKGLNRLTEGDSPDRYGHFSPDSKAVLWSRFSKDYKTSQLMLAESSVKNAKTLTGGKSVDLHATWSPDSKTIVFSSNRSGKDFDLYAIDREGKCLRQITDAKGDELYPSFNADGTKLLFTGNQTGTNQIYLMDFKPSDACLPTN